MKSDIVNRIDALLAEKGLPKMEFYKVCGITSSAYSQWRTGKTTPKISTLEKIAEYLETNVDYLLTGLGEKERKKPAAVNDRLSEREEQIIMMLRDAPPELRSAAYAAALAVLRSQESQS